MPKPTRKSLTWGVANVVGEIEKKLGQAELVEKTLQEYCEFEDDVGYVALNTALMSPQIKMISSLVYPIGTNIPFHDFAIPLADNLGEHKALEKLAASDIELGVMLPLEHGYDNHDHFCNTVIFKNVFEKIGAPFQLVTILGEHVDVDLGLRFLSVLTVSRDCNPFSPDERNRYSRLTRELRKRIGRRFDAYTHSQSTNYVLRASFGPESIEVVVSPGGRILRGGEQCELLFGRFSDWDPTCRRLPRVLGEIASRPVREKGACVSIAFRDSRREFITANVAESLVVLSSYSIRQPEQIRLLFSNEAPRSLGGKCLVEILKETELAVLRHRSAGKTYKEIGAELGISANTVDYRLRRIRSKIGAPPKLLGLDTINGSLGDA